MNISSELEEQEINQAIDRYTEIITNNDRLDLTHLKTYTIDDKNTLEIDDAISLEIKEFKSVLWIHIADVSSIIKKNSLLDLKARQKGTSHYLSKGIITMFPRKIINNVLSLKENKKCLALSISVCINESGEIGDYNIYLSIIKPTYSLSYEEADELIDYCPPEENELSILYKLAIARENYRKKNGALVFDQSNGKFIKSDKDIKIKIVDQTPSRKIVNEMMILLGHITALYGKINNIHLPYRTQFKKNILYPPGYKEEINKDLIESYIKFSQNKAKVSINPGEHYSMGLSCYVQSTSPIRRYSDIICHRQIIDFFQNNPRDCAQEIEELINRSEINSLGALAQFRTDQSTMANLFFESNKTKNFNSHFIKWINLKHKIALLRFINLEINLIVILSIDNKLTFGDFLLVKYLYLDSDSDTLKFKIMNT